MRRSVQCTLLSPKRCSSWRGRLVVGAMTSTLLMALACTESSPEQVEAELDRAQDVAGAPAVDAGETAANEIDTTHVSGTVRHLDLEGGVWVISSGETNYNPINLAKGFQVDGLAVEAELLERDDMASVGMVGPMVEIVEIRLAEPTAAESPADGAAEEEAIEDPAGGEVAVGEALESEEIAAADTGEAESTEEGEGEPSTESEEEPFVLWGTKWQLSDLGGRPAMGQVQATLEFPQEGHRAIGNASCNRFFGQVEGSEDSISFIDVGTMRMACRPAVLDQETRFLAALEAAERFELDGDELRIFAGDREQPMTFRRIADEN